MNFIRKNYIFASPFLFAMYPVIFLYSKNIGEYTESVVVAPLLISLFVAVVVFTVARLIFRNTACAAVVASYVVFTALSYGKILSLTHGNNIFALLLIIVVGAGVVYVNLKHKNKLVTLNKALTVIASILILFSLYPIISFEVKTKRIFVNKEPVTVNTKTVKADKSLPDIYYFIFDRYAGPRSTTKEYGFDNSKFIDSLIDKGFYVAKDSTTNYPKTFLSLGSTFNMDYLDVLTQETNGGASPDESLVTPYIREGEALTFLKKKGYTLVNIGPKTWTPTSKNPYADRNFIMSKGTYPYADIFTTGFLNTTIASPIFKQVFRNPVDVSEDPNNNEHRRVALFALASVRKAVSIPGPKFVFAHILLPHDPFVFDKNCNPISEKEVNRHDHITNYINQLECANTQILSLTSDIMRESETKPVIILQSDEGPFPMKEPVSQDQAWAKASDTALHEKFPILNAYFFPNASNAMLYQTITPINSFRVLFNTYFGTNYPLLEDKNYIFQDENNFYKFTDVTDRIKN